MAFRDFKRKFNLENNYKVYVCLIEVADAESPAIFSNIIFLVHT